VLPGGAGVVRLRQSSRVADGLGGRVWGAAPLLLALLAQEPQRRLLAASAAALELGAGAGLVGLAAHRLGARCVTLTDAGAPQLALLAHNVALNAAGASAPDAERLGLRVRHLDWDAPAGGGACGDGAAQPLPAGERFDVVLAADVLYEPEHAAGVARALAARLAVTASARALLVCPVRCAATAAAFERRLAAEGLTCARQQLPDGASCERYEGGYARFDVAWSQERLLDDGMLMSA